MHHSFALPLVVAACLAALPFSLSAEELERQSIRIIQTVEPRIPDELRTDVPTTGEVGLLINVDSDGRLVDWMIVRFTHEVYARAAADAMQAWRFRPARIGGQPVNARASITIHFESRGRVVSSVAIDTMDMLINRLNLGVVTNRVADAAELDRPLVTEETVQPRFPPSLIGPRTQAASVRLDFYVDERGRPRMPVLVGDANLQFAEAAVDALMQWKFSAPTRKGQPVVVRVQQEFVLTNIAGLDT